MAIETGTAIDHIDLFDKFRRFLCGGGTESGYTYTGAGDGDITVYAPGAGTENWVAVYGGSSFTLTGSESGVQPPIVAGEEWRNGGMVINVTEGSTPFEQGDSFSFSTAQGSLKAEGQAWEELENRDPEGSLSLGVNYPRETHFKGFGLSGDDEIYINATVNATNAQITYDRAFIVLVAAESFNASEPWAGQMGISPTVHLSVKASEMNYWFIANGRRFIIIVKTATVYQACYAGFFLPYATSYEYPYPVFIGGSANDTGSFWDTTDYSKSNFWQPCSGGGGARIRNIDATWTSLTNYAYVGSGGVKSDGARTLPYTSFGVGNSNHPIANMDGSRSLFPITLVSTSSNTTYGELDGVFYVGGVGLQSEDIITINGKLYLVVQSCYRLGAADFAAICLE